MRFLQKSRNRSLLCECLYDALIHYNYDFMSILVKIRVLGRKSPRSHEKSAKNRGFIAVFRPDLCVAIYKSSIFLVYILYS